MASSTTTLKISETLKRRVARLAKKQQQTPHGLMVRAIEEKVSRAERMQQFVGDALRAKSEIEAGGPVYRARDVFAWMERLAKGEKPPRPKPWRK